ncbi:MAG TPA: hydrogenase maturation nickel metallochaperone HypA [Stellaceae bacterium]|nr:hydrogenase maturation nickel metallochaperone HypA [Stellaceae bacterium]
MHETGMVRDLVRRLEQVARERGGGRIAAAQVWLGALSHMSPEHFREHFEEVSRGTVAAGARLAIELSQDPHHPSAQHVVLESVDLET